MNIIDNQMNTPCLYGQDVAQKKAELKAYLLNSWNSYESLFDLINDDEAFYLRPESLRHPLIFYFGHTATFYINKLMLGKFIPSRINERIEAICAVGVDEMSWDDLDSQHYDWPSVDEVKTYRQQVLTLVCELIDNMELSLPISQDSLAWIMLMGAEHERIHLETSSVIMRMLPLKYIKQTSPWVSFKEHSTAPENLLLNVKGQHIVLGKKPSDQTYGWDNEFGQAEITVPDFQASQFLVSNEEFLGFVKANGYQSPQYWTKEGQNWLNYKKPLMPRFWRLENNIYYQRNLTDEIPLPLNWPVEVNYLEAHAFCQWKSELTGQSIRLPSEPEWYALRENMPEALRSEIASWQEPSANINLSHGASSCPVNSFSQGDFYDVVGNVWQWTVSEIDAFEGFNVHPLYDDFSTPTFDGQHNLIKGGSWVSTGNETIKSSRYAFRRHFFQHAGFRYVKNDADIVPKISVNPFETNLDICQQLEAHYSQPQVVQQNYPKAVANKIRDIIYQQQTSTTKLLDIGCSVGRVSFELAREFDHIDGVDFSARLIQHGVKLQSEHSLRYALKNEGDIVDFKEVQLHSLDLPSGDNIAFCQGDAGNLKAIFTDYDVILAQHIIEQHYDPTLFFKQAHTRLNKNGLLLVLTDHRFNETFTDKSKWFGGIKVNGENMTGVEGLAQKLRHHFDLLEQHELQQELKVDARNFSISHKNLSVWRLK